jgi:hypothetical protein
MGRITKVPEKMNSDSVTKRKDRDEEKDERAAEG